MAESSQNQYISNSRIPPLKQDSVSMDCAAFCYFFHLGTHHIRCTDDIERRAILIHATPEAILRRSESGCSLLLFQAS